MPLPSVLLHDHLDGGLRPATVLDLAETYGYDGLPSGDEAKLATWFDQSGSGSLERYLEAFQHTTAVMQHRDAIERVAYEAAVDLAADGVVYAQIRFNPPQHVAGGLSMAEVIEAVASGLAVGERETGMKWSLTIDSLRHLSLSMARLAVSERGHGVTAFDLAGPEAGNPPRHHVSACRLIRESGLCLTIHAGEAAGPAYIAESMDVCGAERLGHGVEIINNCVVEDGEIVKLGPVAHRVRDRQVALEMCPASNMATGELAPEAHPLGALYRAGFNVTLNTDNRLMSQTSMSSEFAFARDHHGFQMEDLALITRRALAAAFCGYEDKVEYGKVPSRLLTRPKESISKIGGSEG